MLPTSRTLRLSLYTLLIFAGATIAATLAMRHAERQALVEDAARANQQLALYATSLHTLIDRYRALPSVLALDPQLRDWPERPGCRSNRPR
jgi:two-component system C4-dicarboxylate transport sensor histidine kinase DctB